MSAYVKRIFAESFLKYVGKNEILCYTKWKILKGVYQHCRILKTDINTVDDAYAI